MKKLKSCFFYLLIFVVLCNVTSVNTYAQQTCRIYANTQSSSTGLLSSITNQNAPIGIADTTDFSTLSVTLSVASVITAYQRLNFPSAAVANTPIIVKVANVSPNEVVIQAYNNNTAVGPAVSGSSLSIFLGTSVNGNSFVRLVPTGAYDNVRITINSTLGIASSVSILYAYQDISPSASFNINTAVQCLEGNSYSFTNTSTISSGTLTYLWNFGDGSATSTVTSPSHTYTSAGVYTVRLTATGTNGCASSSTKTVTVIGGLFAGSLINLPFYWVGADGADWGTPSNWRVSSSGYFYIPSVIPTSSNAVYIGLAANTLCSQVIKQNITIGANTVAQCSDLYIGNSATIKLNGSLTITGNLSDVSTGSYGIIGSPTGKLTFNGTGGPTILRFVASNQQLSSLEILRSNGASAAVTLASPLAVFSYVNLAANNILESGTGNLTLKSTSTNTASVYALPPGASIKGTVNAERFFYAGGNPAGSSAYRSYRLISSPVSNAPVNNSGPQPAPVYNLNYIKAGAIVTGAANGNFDKTGNPTFYLFREDVNSSNATFTSGNFRGISKIDPTLNDIGTQSRFNLNNVPDTTIQLPAGNGVLFFFRGDRTDLNGKTVAPFSLPQDVTFTNSGMLNQGNISVKLWFKPKANLSYTNSSTVSNSGVMGYNLVGNPYPCTIDWNTNSAKSGNPGILFSGNADVDTKIYVFDPLAKTYNWFDSSIGANGGNDGNPAVSQYIASGQGFFIRAKNSNATLTFTEAAKVNTINQPQRVLLGLPKPSANDLSAIKIQLKQDSVNYDYAAIYFKENWKADYDAEEDAADLDGNGNTVNLSTFSADRKRLAINKMPALFNQTNKIPLYVKGNSGRYALVFPELADIPAQYHVFLKDNFNNDSLRLTNNIAYNFNIDQANPNTFGDKRFELVFQLPDTSNYRLLSFEGKQETNSFVLNWTTWQEKNYTAFTLEKSVDNGKTFASMGTVQSDFKGTYNYTDSNPFAGESWYRLKQDDLYNRITYSDPVKLIWQSMSDNRFALLVYPNPVVNQLNISLFKEQKGLIRSRIINMQGNIVITQDVGSSKWMQSVQSLSPGIYLLEVRNLSSGLVIGQTKFIKK